MTSRSTFVPEARVDRLLRSLIGVADVRIRYDPDGMFTDVAILRDGRVQEHQLIRNVISALKAGFGVRLEAAQVSVVVDSGDWPGRVGIGTEVGGESAPGEPAGDERPTTASRGRVVVGSVTNGGRPHRSVSGSPGLDPIRAVADAESAERAGVRRVRPLAGTGRRPRLESVDVDRHGLTLRCRVAVRVGDAVFSAVSEVRDAPSAEAELAARVTLDALRAGGLTSDQFDGVALTSIAGNIFVVAAVRGASGMTPRACAAPLVHTMATAAAEAVLRAHGPVVPNERALSASSGT